MILLQDPNVEISETSQLSETRSRTLREELHEEECSQAILALHFLSFLLLCLLGGLISHQTTGNLFMVATFLVSMVGAAGFGVSLAYALNGNRERRRRIKEVLEGPPDPDQTQNG